MRDALNSIAAAADRPAAQIVRDLIRDMLARVEHPNATTRAAMRAARRGDVTRSTPEELYRDLGI